MNITDQLNGTEKQHEPGAPIPRSSRNLKRIALLACIFAFVFLGGALFFDAPRKAIRVDIVGDSGVFVVGPWNIDGQKTYVATQIPHSFEVKARKIEYYLTTPNPADGKYAVRFTIEGKVLSTDEVSAGRYPAETYRNKVYRIAILKGELSIGWFGAKLRRATEIE